MSNIRHGKYRLKPCKECGTETKNRKYCSPDCSREGMKKEWEQKLRNGEITYSYTNGQIRRWLLRTREHRCESCKLTEWLGKQINLTVEHKDGDASNNVPSNLLLLCWNCHSMTETFGNKNKREGQRKYRK